MKQAILDIINERLRQVAGENFGFKHDDKHTNGEMAVAAACYAGDRRKFNKASPTTWPWEEKWWKPKSYRSNLIRAAALLVAEIERIDRLEPK